MGAPLSATQDSFTVTITDAHGGQTTQTITVAINPTNTAPVAGTPLVGTANPTTGTVIGSAVATDPNTDTLTYTGPTTSTGGGTVTVSPTGAFTYTPTTTSRQAAVGSPLNDSFTVTITDAHGGQTTQTITVPVDPITAVVVTGLQEPTDLRFLPDGRMLISERGGVVLLASRDGQIQSQPVIGLPMDTINGRGLLGIEVDPNFTSNGYIYAIYVTSSNYERLSRFTVTDPQASILAANPASELVLIEGSQEAADDHLGGGIRFGPDGKLYWTMGNNDGWAIRPPGFVYPSNNAQDLSNIYGKVLRLNPDGSVPTDNPFANTPGVNPYIYAYGFRNPFRIAFTTTGALLVTDVGELTWEELDNVTAGANYGWPLAEGPCDGVGTPSCSIPSSYNNPIYTYDRNLPGVGTSFSAAITGVLAYTSPGGQGQNLVFISDWSRGWTEELTCNSDYTSCGNSRTVDTTSLFDGPVALVQGPDGLIYEVHVVTGTISRLAPTSL
ncbi:hypothetical protein FEG63_00005 [Mycolicibacterium sphagni]|uniref:Glucose/Sorbosone dehydrogenase domain-containing protein n=1 Tax=Mycolicibacterium sphagni TaxID=1786 RepID=A0ABX2JST5_9MYCO|nr:hypothetical protein [Mycolicibacterium sphagni]